MTVETDAANATAAPDLTTLTALVGLYLNRSDLTAMIPKFIELASWSFNRTIWVSDREATVSATVSTSSYTLPADMYQIRAAFVDATDDTPLQQISVDELRSRIATTGTPKAFALRGRTMLFDPQPDTAFTLSVRYYASISILGTTNTTNWLLARHPDIYLYGALVQAEAFLGNDQRIGLWNAALEKAIAELNDSGNRQTVSQGPIKMRVARVV